MPRKRNTKPKQLTNSAWRNIQQARREERIADGRFSPEEVADQNLRKVFEPRKPPPTTWIAVSWDTCLDCNRPIEPGQRIHNRPGVGLVHHRHDRTEVLPEACPTCWMVGPCEC